MDIQVVLDQLVDFMEANKKFGFKNPSIEAGEYRGYKVRIKLESIDENPK